MLTSSPPNWAIPPDTALSLNKTSPTLGNLDERSTRTKWLTTMYPAIRRDTESAAGVDEHSSRTIWFTKNNPVVRRDSEASNKLNIFSTPMLELSDEQESIGVLPLLWHLFHWLNISFLDITSQSGHDPRIMMLSSRKYACSFAYDERHIAELVPISNQGPFNCAIKVCGC